MGVEGSKTENPTNGYNTGVNIEVGMNEVFYFSFLF